MNKTAREVVNTLELAHYEKLGILVNARLGQKVSVLDAEGNRKEGIGRGIKYRGGIYLFVVCLTDNDITVFIQDSMPSKIRPKTVVAAMRMWVETYTGQIQITDNSDLEELTTLINRVLSV